MPYTGCNPRGLTLARDKVLTKKILAYHRIRTPDFVALPRRVARWSGGRGASPIRCWSSR